MFLLPGSILTVALFHLKLSGELPGVGYVVALDYAFYVTYTLIVFQIVILILSFREQRRGNEARVGRLFLTNKIVYPAVILLGGLLYLSYYGVITLPSFKSEQAVTTEFASLQTPANASGQPISEQATFNSELYNFPAWRSTVPELYEEGSGRSGFAQWSQERKEGATATLFSS